MGKKTAAILSFFIIGLGQFYAGHLWRALAWFFGSVLILSALTLTTGFGGLAVGPFLSIASAWDAYSIYGD
ncbi:MAG TPA: hypothetical protein PLM24_09215 [Methanothrix sp.]|nr:hypothetical protein [Methanothrix sp.]HPJ85254.1 hypothetical protein [Methanothrix sp.]HPR67298.1 hypothetical protein [Methanothrix sp.]